jgi:hypothetical protein
MPKIFMDDVDIVCPSHHPQLSLLTCHSLQVPWKRRPEFLGLILLKDKM